MLLGSGLDIARDERGAQALLALGRRPARARARTGGDALPRDLRRRRRRSRAPSARDPARPIASTVARRDGDSQARDLFQRIPQTHRDYLAAVRARNDSRYAERTHPAFAHVSARVIGSNRTAVDGARPQRARGGLGRGRRRTSASTGEAARAGEAIARQLIERAPRAQRDRCRVWGGETTVTLDARSRGARPSGGGRCQELALAAARVLARGRRRCARASRCSRPAPTAATARPTRPAPIVDATTWSAIAAGGRDPGARARRARIERARCARRAR